MVAADIGAGEPVELRLLILLLFLKCSGVELVTICNGGGGGGSNEVDVVVLQQGCLLDLPPVAGGDVHGFAILQGHFICFIFFSSFLKAQ